jgi:TatD DNase family protein
MPPLIDSHCHLAGFAREGLLPGVLDRANEQEIVQMIAIGTEPSDWRMNRDIAAEYTGRIFYTAGLHPCDIDEEWESALTQLGPLFIPPNPPVALGEMGLDHFHLPKDPVEAGKAILRQEEAFSRQLELALQLDCPVVIHSRDCFGDTVRVIDESGVDWEKIVFHCFTYGPEEMRVLLDRGGRASFTGIATYKNAGKIREAARLQGVEKLMVETDAPYLTPEPVRKEKNEPAKVYHTAELLARELQMPLETFAARTTANARAFFNLPDA